MAILQNRIFLMAFFALLLAGGAFAHTHNIAVAPNAVEPGASTTLIFTATNVYEGQKMAKIEINAGSNGFTIDTGSIACPPNWHQNASTSTRAVCQADSNSFATDKSVNVSFASISPVSAGNKTWQSTVTWTDAHVETKSVKVYVKAPVSTLTVTKIVVNNNGGTKTAANFTLRANNTPSNFTTFTSGVAQNVGAGNYTISEDGPSGYSASFSGDCDENGAISLLASDNKTCVITNDDQPGTLIVRKVLIQDNGGTAAVTDFSFSVNGSEPVHFEADGQNEMTINAGIYEVTEPSASGYTTTYDNCQSSVTVPNGGNGTCTITNDDVPSNDTSSPVVRIQSPANQSMHNVHNLDINYTATDGSAIASCFWYAHGEYMGAIEGCANLSQIWFGDNNSHNITICANDTSGNTGCATAYFAVDTIAPAVAMQSPANSTYNSSSLLLNYTATDANLDSCWHVLDGGASVALPSCTNAPLGPLSDGAHNVTVYANDTAGNTGSATVYFTVGSAANTPPVIAVQTPAENQSFNSSEVPLNFTATDESLDSCWYSLDSGPIVLLASCANATIPELPEGAHNVTIFANDTEGAESSVTVAFTVDLTAPGPLALLSPANGDSSTNTNPSFSWNVSDNLSPLLNCTLYIDGVLNAANLLATSGVPFSTAASSPIAVGAHTWFVIAYDSAGNSITSETRSLTVNALPAPPQPPSGGGGGGGGSGGSGGGSSGSYSRFKDCPVDLGNGKICYVKVKREIDSSTSLSTMTTTLFNVDGVDCNMEDFIFVDSIPYDFASFTELEFVPPYDVRDGSKVAWQFPSFAGGESKVLTYSVGRWLTPSKVNSFDICGSLSAKKEQPAANVQKNETKPNTPSLSGSVPNRGKLWEIPEPATGESNGAAPLVSAALLDDMFGLRGIWLFICPIGLLALALLLFILFYKRKKCPKCKTMNRRGSKICKKCGYKFGSKK